MNIGLIYIVIAQFLWATQIILIRRFFPSVNSIPLSAIGSVIGSIFYLPTIFIFKEKIASLKPWLILFIYAFTSWFLAQIFYVYDIQNGRNALAISLIILTMPLFTFILSAIFLKETITLKLIIGGILMIIGFLLISL